MTTRHAACSCGQLHLTIEGESARISLCHCLACQRRTGAVSSALRLTFESRRGFSEEWLQNRLVTGPVYSQLRTYRCTAPTDAQGHQATSVCCASTRLACRYRRLRFDNQQAKLI